MHDVQAHCILEILPKAEASQAQQAFSELSAQTALEAAVTLKPGMALVPDMIERVWEGVSQHAASSKGM